MIRLTLISSWTVLLVLLTACGESGPAITDAKSCFQNGGFTYSFDQGCVYKNPEMK